VCYSIKLICLEHVAILFRFFTVATGVELMTGTRSLGAGEGGTRGMRSVKIEGSDGCSGCDAITDSKGNGVSGDPCAADCSGSLKFVANADWVNGYDLNTNTLIGICGQRTISAGVVHGIILVLYISTTFASSNPE
jgi:hypothetical protein